MMENNFYNQERGFVGIIAVLAAVILIFTGLYFYLQTQAPEIDEMTEELVEEKIVEPEKETISPVKEQVEEEKFEITKPEVEITARRIGTANKNLPLGTGFNILFALAEYQEFEKGEELQAEVRIAPSKEITALQTWAVGYTIKNTTDSSFALTYDFKPSSYKTSGAVAVDPDGNGPKEYFYYTFGEEVLLLPNSEQYLDISLIPPKDLTEITPKVIFKGFSAKDPFFIHEFAVKIISVHCGECKKPVCKEGEILWDVGGVDDCMCPIFYCVQSGERCVIISPEGACIETPLSCDEIGIGEGWTIVDECPE